MSETTMRFTIEGRGPLLMHNGQLANPMAPITRVLSKLTKTRSKNENVYSAIARAEWIGGLYVDRALDLSVAGLDIALRPSPARVVIPGSSLKAMIVEAAKAQKKGRDAKAAISCDTDWPLEYDGPKDPSELLNDPAFMDIRGTRVGRARVMRTRPIFRKWSLTFEVEVDTSVIEKADVVEMISHGGRRIGLGDNRPDCGRFVVSSAPEADAAPRTAKAPKRTKKTDHAESES